MLVSRMNLLALNPLMALVELAIVQVYFLVPSKGEALVPVGRL